MRKWEDMTLKVKTFLLIFFSVIMLALTNVDVKAVEFVKYNNENRTGTYADTFNKVIVEFSERMEVDEVKAKLQITDANNNPLEVTRILALDEIAGLATRYQIDLKNNLDKTKTYKALFEDLSIQLNLDTTAPYISYTNQVRNDMKRYDERENVFLVQGLTQNTFERLFGEKEEFNIYEYLRINIVDNRDGSLMDKMVIENLPNPYKPGTYVVKIKATDSWNNEAVQEFTFKVVKNTDKTDLAIDIVTFTGVGLIIGFSIFFILKRRSVGRN